MPSAISVIIVNYNTRDLLAACLRSLTQDPMGGEAETIVVDNASSDGSVEMLRSEYPGVRVIESPCNVGFAKATNLGLAAASGPYVLLLNSDTVVHPGAIGALIGTLESYPEAAVVAPRLTGADGQLQRSCFRFPTPARALIENLFLARIWRSHPILGDYGAWDHDQEREVDFAIGAALLVRREAIDRVGGLDEQFFMYSEETDWCYRIRLAGWSVRFTPAATVTHLGGGSSLDAPLRMRAQVFQSLDQYQLKHHGMGGLIVFRTAMVVGSLLRFLLYAALLLQPSREQRQMARQKIALHRYLMIRQLLCRPPSAVGSP